MVILGFTSAIIAVMVMRFVYAKSVIVSRKVHNDMITRILRAPCNLFFDRVPLGRIINRFSGDLATIDDGFASNFQLLATNLLAFTGSVLVCMYLGSLFVLPIVLGFYQICKYI